MLEEHKQFEDFLPVIFFDIKSFLIKPAWATDRSLDANTLTSEKSLGSVFSMVHRVLPLMIRVKRYLDPTLVRLIFTGVHSLRGGFEVLKNFFPDSVDQKRDYE